MFCLKFQIKFLISKTNLMSMKGASLITFIVIISLSFIFLLFITFILYRYSENTKKNLKEQATRQIAFEIISEITNLYEKGSKMDLIPLNNSITLLESKLDLPEKISGEPYYIEAISSPGLLNYIVVNDSLKEEYGKGKIAIVFQNEKYYFDLPIMPIVFQGRTTSEEFKIKYARYRLDNEVKDTIIIGEQKNLIDIEVLQ